MDVNDFGLKHLSYLKKTQLSQSMKVPEARREDEEHREEGGVVNYA